MRIAIDVMGGDHAPDAIVAGSLNAVDLLGEDDQLVLIGDESVIEELIQEYGPVDRTRLEIQHASQVVEMDELPVAALRGKTDSSIAHLARLGGKRHSGDKHCHVIISAGNTGACVAAAQMQMRRLHGVTRPGIAVTLPTMHGPIVLCDVGANPEPRPHHLHQYAHMASVYAKLVMDMADPRVALLSIGGEEGKGNTLVRDAHKLISEDPGLNYVGYVEGRELFDHKADVIVTEGFTGNVVLKLSEGLAAGLFQTIAAEVMEVDPELAIRFQPVVESIYKKHDYHEYGGAPLLGANGICLICHGSSEARSIAAAVRTAIKYSKLGVNEGIVEALARHAVKETVT